MRNKIFKLSRSQEFALRYFATGVLPSFAAKVTEATYHSLKRRGLIEEIDAFPFHQATTAGHAQLAEMSV